VCQCLCLLFTIMCFSAVWVVHLSLFHLRMSRDIRRWKALDHDQFRRALLKSDLCDADNRPCILPTSSSTSMTAFSALWPMNLLRSRNLALGDNGWRSGWTQNASDSVATPECSRGGTGRLCRRRTGLRGFSMKERDMQFTVRRSLHAGMHGSHLTDHHPRSYGVHLTP